MADLDLAIHAEVELIEHCPAVDTSVLTQRQTVVLYLLYVRNMDTQQAADELGCNERAVRAVHARALERLREMAG